MLTKGYSSNCERHKQTKAPNGHLRQIGATKADLKPLSNTQCFNGVLGEICDSTGRWHTGWLSFSHLAEIIGTSTADLMRRLKLLGIVEHREGRHWLTSYARKRNYGMSYRRNVKDNPRKSIDVMLPDGMVFLVQNLKRTNLPITKEEELSAKGLSLSDIAARMGCSKQAVHKRLKNIPARLNDWPMCGTWEDCDDDVEGLTPSTSQCVPRNTLRA